MRDWSSSFRLSIPHVSARVSRCRLCNSALALTAGLSAASILFIACPTTHLDTTCFAPGADFLRAFHSFRLRRYCQLCFGRFDSLSLPLGFVLLIYFHCSSLSCSTGEIRYASTAKYLASLALLSRYRGSHSRLGIGFCLLFLRLCGATRRLEGPLQFASLCAAFFISRLLLN